MSNNMSDADRAILRRLLIDYGTDGVLESMADWLDEEFACLAMAQSVRDFRAGKLTPPGVFATVIEE